MKHFINAKEILELVLFADLPIGGMDTGITRNCDFMVIPGQHGPRWIVPACPRLGMSILTQWHPYTCLSLLKWKGILFFYAMGMLGKVPGIYSVNIGSLGGMRMPKMDSSFTPVVYVGTPGPQQKAVVSLVSPRSGELQVIMKIALGYGAPASMLHEAMILEKLADADVPGVPALLAIAEDGSRSWQTVVKGQLTSRKLTQAHIDWLLQLPRAEKTTTLNEQREILQHYFEENLDLFGKYREIISSSIAMIQGGIIPLVLVHGDFTPWNLKRQTDGKIVALDWEDADPAGLPLWDLCHFFFMQAHLFREKNPIKRLAVNPLVQNYLLHLGVGRNKLAPLVLLYILETVGNRKGSCSLAYKNFLLRQLMEIACS